MGKFADDILRFRIKVEDQSSALFRKVVLDFHAKIVERTPVDTGAARANWNLNIGPEPTWTEVTAFSATAGIGEEGGPTGYAGTLVNWKPGETVWISNGLPYIRVLEYGLYPNPPKKGTGKTESGFSTQAIGGMVSVSAAEFGDIIEEVA